MRLFGRLRSTYAGNLKLAETSQEWSDFETAFGEVSLLNALAQAKSVSGQVKTDYLVNSAIAANDNFEPGVNADVINGSVQDLFGYTFLTKVLVYLNGQLLIPGADATANNDYYPGTDLTNSELKFEFDVPAGAQLSIIAFA